jgi:hypothetical protein
MSEQPRGSRKLKAGAISLITGGKAGTAQNETAILYLRAELKMIIKA